MNPKPSKSRVAGAFTLAAAFGVSGLFVAPAAFADEASAPVSGEAYEAFALNQVLVEEEVAGVAKDANNDIVITVVSQEGEAIAALEDKYENVQVRRINKPFEAYWQDDIVGGGGYLAGDEAEDRAYGSCSHGFNAWDASGNPVTFSAGHCADASTTVEYVGDWPNGEWVVAGVDPTAVMDAAWSVRPSKEPAVGGAIEDNTDIAGENTRNFEVIHFGGPDIGDPGNEGNADSLDVSVISAAPSLTYHPLVTTWANAPSDDFVTDAVQVRSVGNPSVGDPAQKSGRTTGFTTGAEVTQVDGWWRIDGMVVRGFEVMSEPGNVWAAPGDSGGAVLSGTQAIGLISGGADNHVVIADIDTILEHYDYEVMLYLDAPTLTNPADGSDVEAGATISGEAPSGSTVVVTVDGDVYETITVSGGQWSFPAPEAEGEFTFTIHAEEGFDKSESNTYTLNVVAAEEPPAPVVADPVVTSPADGAEIVESTNVSAITGTGEPDAEISVYLNNELLGTAVVDADGNWEFALTEPLAVGEYTINADQFINDETIFADPVTFTIVADEAPVDPTPVDPDPEDPVDPDPVDPAPVDPAPEQPGDELPPTGADPFVLYGAMAVLALLGVAAFMIRGRKTEVQQ